MLSPLLLVAVVALVYYIFNYYRYIRRYPPGPLPLPLIGNIHQLNIKAVYKSFEKMADKHGNVFTVFLPNPMVVLADYAAVKEAFVTKGECFVGRPQGRVVSLLGYLPNGGIINSTGPMWRTQRRAALNILRDSGMGSNLMEQQVNESIVEFLRNLDEMKNKERVDMRWPIQIMIANIINEVTFGYRYKYDDCDQLIEYVNNVDKFFEDITTSPTFLLGLHYPWIIDLPIVRKYAYEQHRTNIDNTYVYIREEVKKALEGFDVESDEPTCFVQAYRQKMLTNTELSEDQMHHVASDFFMAGQETTATTMRWAALFLADNQEAQERMREELSRVLGCDRFATMADRPRLPFNCAVVHEVQRMANIAGLNIQHVAVEDVVVQGHLIPKGSYVNGDIHQVMARDPIFVQSEKFMPQRYLLEDGVTLNKKMVERTIPYSIGKRMCAGESLARMELFLGLTALVQHYRILPPLDSPINYEHGPKAILTPSHTNFLRLEPVQGRSRTRTRTLSLLSSYVPAEKTEKTTTREERSKA